MQFGLMLPNKGKTYADPALLVELAMCAEKAGWQGFFLWDHIGGVGDAPVVDPWICLAAVASQTKTIRFGTMITPLSRRRPWKVAREIVTLDHLSGGRVILGVGLGDLVNKDFKDLGEISGPRTRARMLDESLEIIAGLQSGLPFSYSGKHYKISDERFLPMPLQKPTIPVWVSAHWPFKRPLMRAARWDGVLPRPWNTGPITPEIIREIKDFIMEHRTLDRPFDIIKYGATNGKDLTADHAVVEEFSKAGATWWVEEIHPGRGTIQMIRERIAAGPPSADQ